MSRVELLSPKVDFVFKRIFGTEENKDVLAHFLNSVFEDSGEPLIADVEILNPFLEKEALSDKLAVLDVKARTGERDADQRRGPVVEPPGYGKTNTVLLGEAVPEPTEGRRQLLCVAEGCDNQCGGFSVHRDGG
nr:PD-(D/E)XK nuclease family transposase [Kyrpidia sp.]